MNIARRLRNEAEVALMKMIQKEEDKNIAIENAVRSFNISSTIYQDKNTDHKLIHLNNNLGIQICTIKVKDNDNNIIFLIAKIKI